MGRGPARLLVAAMLLGGCARSARTTVGVAAVALGAAVEIHADGCRTVSVLGAGSVIAGGYVLTAAHVVSGAQTIVVRPAASGAAAATARLVAIDPINDLALLAVGRLNRAPLALGTAGTAAMGNVVVFRDGNATVLAFTIIKPVIVRILDIHHEHTISRPGFEVNVAISAGDSGAVMVDADGKAIGVLYAKSRADDNRTFASDTGAVAALVASAADIDPTVGIASGDCV